MGEFPTSMMLLEASLAGEVTGEENKREYVAGRRDEECRFFRFYLPRKYLFV